MIRAIANKGLDLSKEEFSYFKELKSSFGEDEFKGLFATDSNGNIISITPSTSSPISMVILFFLLNVMLNQRLRGIDKTLKKIEHFDNRLEKIEKEMKLKRKTGR